jgi:hypothetical protein
MLDLELDRMTAYSEQMESNLDSTISTYES